MNDPMGISRDSFEWAQDRLPGSGAPWLLRQRSQAMEAFQQLGLPDMRVEAWKYTSLRRLQRRSFKPAVDTAVVTDISPWLLGDELMHRLVFIDGYYRSDLQPFRTLLSGATLCSLATALEERPDDVEHIFCQTLNVNTPGFNALNTAFMNDGAWIKLEQDAIL
jgi:Fe-S cluster assembly protein SufD